MKNKHIVCQIMVPPFSRWVTVSRYLTTPWVSVDSLQNRNNQVIDHLAQAELTGWG